MLDTTLDNRYRILKMLGEGGFGQTLLAEDSAGADGEKICVVKKLQPHQKDPKTVSLATKLFQQEVEVLYRLGKHERIPKLIRHFGADGEFFLVQEYVEGATLAQELKDGKRFSDAETVELLKQILEILSFVHAQGVIHRDIKPSNLMRRAADGQIVLIDFGAVKQVNLPTDGAAERTHSTVAIGSEGYMPVEQYTRHPRFSSDVYAVGMVAIQCLTGLHPTRLRQSERTGEWIWQDNIQVNLQLANILSRMIRFDYRQRYQDAAKTAQAVRLINSRLPDKPSVPYKAAYSNRTRASVFRRNAVHRKLAVPDRFGNVGAGLDAAERVFADRRRRRFAVCRISNAGESAKRTAAIFSVAEFSDG